MPETPDHTLHDALAKAARLAHLEMPAERLEALIGGAERILAHVERMGSMELEGVEPLVHPLDGVGALASDEPGGVLSPDDLMRIAPVTHPPFVKVPKVIDGGSS